jgi:hypothetical protein
LNKGEATTWNLKPKQDQPVIPAAWNCVANDLEGNAATIELFSGFKSDEDSGIQPFLRVSFGLVTQLPYIKLKVLLPPLEGNHEPVFVTIFGIRLSYKQGVNPLRKPRWRKLHSE